jgi:aminobenzoyl-glutamate transport protein
MSQASEAPRTVLQKLLDGVETVGNKVPHPAVIFLVLMGVVVLLSHVFYLMGTSVSYQRINPQTHAIEDLTAAVKSLLTADGIRFLLTSAVRNFLNFGPVGVILVAMVGVGLAEQAGLIGALIHKLIKLTPRRAITFIVVFLGICSSIASDAGYLVLIPLGAGVFLSLGRHPLAGLAAAFSGVGAVFGVNFLITPIDGILTEITNDAIHLLNPADSIDLTANLYFAIVSSLVLCVVCTVITEKFVEPRLGAYHGEVPSAQGEGVSASEEESRGLTYALYALLGVVVVLALLTLPPGAPLRHPATGAIVGNSPFMDSLIVLITLVFLVMGVAYGVGAKTVTSSVDAINAITQSFASLSGLILLFLVISQFIAYFNYSNMATVAAVKMADFLKSANFGSLPLLLGFIAVVGIVGVIIVGVIPKWALFAPIFVPLFMKLNVAPEVVLAAYRVADSPPNVITPLMPYFGLIVVFVQRYQPEAGVGTVVAMMLPYYVGVFAVWTLLLVAWFLLGLPLGPG